MITIGPPHVFKDSDSIRLSVDVTSNSLPKTLWFSFPLQCKDYICPHTSDWALISVLLPAMLQGEDVTVRGCVSPMLLQSVGTDLQYVLAHQNNRLTRVNVNAEVATGPLSGGDGVGTGFSAGVDSFASIALLSESAQPVTHLCTFNVGAMGAGHSASALMERYKARLDGYCKENSFLPFLVDSNIAEFFQAKQGLGFQSTHTVRAVAAVLAAQQLFRTYYYASTFDYRQIGVHSTYDISYADPIILPLLSTERTQFRALGTHLSRIDKVKLLAGFVDSYSHLDVCVDDPEDRVSRAKPNCSMCWKCGRQLITLRLLEKDHLYEDVFDIDQFDGNKEKIVYRLALDGLGGDRSNEFDVVVLAYELGFLSGPDPKRMLQMASWSWKVRIFLARRIARQLARKI